MVEFSIFSQENTDPQRKDPENTREKAVNLVYQRTYTSGFVIVVFLLGLFFGFIPIPFIGLLPSYAGEALLLAIVANIIAFLPARWYHVRYNDIPRDFIYVANADDEEFVKRFEYYEGFFKEQFEFEGSPISWNSKYGRSSYLVREIDHENAIAQCSEFGELTDLEQLQNIEKIKANRLQNRKWAKIGMKLFARMETIEDKAKTEYFQNLVRKGLEYTSYDPDKLMETVEEDIPEIEEDEDETSEIQELMRKINSDELDVSVDYNPDTGE